MKHILSQQGAAKNQRKKECILLNLAGEEAVRYNSFTYNEDKDKDDPDVMTKFKELCMPLKNLFHTRSQRPSVDWFLCHSLKKHCSEM